MDAKKVAYLKMLVCLMKICLVDAMKMVYPKMMVCLMKVCLIHLVDVKMKVYLMKSHFLKICLVDAMSLNFFLVYLIRIVSVFFQNH